MGYYLQKKSWIALVFLSGILSSCSSSQNASKNTNRGIKTIEFDFQDKTITPSAMKQIKNIKPGDFFRVEIDDINLNLYTVKVNNSDSTINQQLKMPGFSDFGFSDVSKMMTAGFGTVGAPYSNMELVIPMNFGQQRKREEDTLLDKAWENISLMTNSLAIDHDSLENVKETINNISFEYNRNLLAALYDTVCPPPNIQKTANSIKTLYDSLGQLRTTLYSLNNTVQDSLKSYQVWRLGDKYRNLISKNEGLHAEDSIIINQFKSLNLSLSAAIDSVSAAKIFQYVSSLISVRNNSSSTYNSLPLEFTQDQATVDIKIQPRSNQLALQSYETKIVLPVGGGGYWGLSTGFYYGWQLPNHAYTSKENPDSSYSLVAEDMTSNEFGIDALFNAGYDCQTWEHFPRLGWAVSIGLGIPFSDKVRPRLMAMISLAIGNEHKLLLQVGPVWGYVDKLSNAYNISGDYLTNPGNPVVSSVTRGWCFSVSYMFF